MNRNLRLVPLAAGLCLLAGAVGTAQAQVVPANQDLTGVWWATSVPTRLKPMDGSPIPFTDVGKQKYDEIRAGLKSGKIVDRAVHLCLPQGVPRAYLTAWPIQLVSTVQQTTVFFEENRQTHQVRYLAKHHDPDLWDPSYMGESIAHWEGDTLVADTNNFNDESYLDATGLPHDDKLRVVEKFRKIKGGKQLEVVTTIDDPAIYSKPWSSRFVYDRRDDVEVDTSWICGEPHRDASKVKRIP